MHTELKKAMNSLHLEVAGPIVADISERIEKFSMQKEISTGVDLIYEERLKQREKYSVGHDQDHSSGELAKAAAALCVFGTDASIVDAGDFIDYDFDCWGLVEKHQNDRIKRLQIAGALIAAEIDRINVEGQIEDHLNSKKD